MISVGLIGTGYWGANLCRALSQSPSIELRWVCDMEPSALARAAAIAPHALVSAEVDRLLGDANLDAVVLATPAATHAPLGLRALASGKHLLVEKPLALSSADADALCNEAAMRQLILMVGHTYLYNPAVRRIGEMIDEGYLGDIHYAFCQRLNLGIVRQDVDALWNLAPHDVSMLQFWFRRPVIGVDSVGHAYLQPGICDVAFAHLTYEGGVSGHLHVSWLDPGKTRRVTIVGSSRMLVFDDISAEARLMIFDKGMDRASIGGSMGPSGSFAEHRFLVRAGDVWMPRVDSREPLSIEVEAFAHSVETGTEPLSDGRQGAEVVRTLERASAAMRLAQPEIGFG
jgi:predicted dehydrogenase